MNVIDKRLKELQKNGVGIVTDRVEERNKIYYRIDDTVIEITVTEEV